MNKLLLGLLPATAAVFAVAPQTAHAQAGGGQPDGHVEAQVVGIEWKRPLDPDTAYASIGTLTVLKNTEVVLRAVKDDPKKDWSPGKPEWSGSSGASGTGTPSISLKFSTLSTSATDLKTIVAKASGGSQATANAIVCDVNITTKAQDQFINRSEEQYGVGEVVDASLSVLPSGVSASSIGSIKWALDGTAEGKVPSDASGDTTTFTAGTVEETATLRVSFTSGPSQGKSVSVPRDVLKPSAAIFELDPPANAWHVHDIYSAGFVAKAFVFPRTVSFAAVKINESSAVSTAHNWLAPEHDKLLHSVGNLFSIGMPAGPSSGREVANFRDFVGIWDTAEQHKKLPYGQGDFSWPISWEYSVNGGSHKFALNATVSATTNANGDAYISKLGKSVSTLLQGPSSTPPFWYDVLGGSDVPR